MNDAEETSEIGVVIRSHDGVLAIEVSGGDQIDRLVVMAKEVHNLIKKVGIGPVQLMEMLASMRRGEEITCDEVPLS